MAATAQRVRFLAEAAASALAPREASRSGKVREVVEYEPLGVVANVSAWNYPYFVASNVFAAALATVVGLQALFIVAGNLASLPLTGITLPFVSYGGTGLIANFALAGVLLRLSAREDAAHA